MDWSIQDLPRRAALAAAGAGLLFLCASSTALGQAPAAATTPAASGKGIVLGTGMFTSFVENMDRSLAFYHEAFGLDVPALPPSGARPYNAPNPRLFAMFAIPGARERHQSARLPGTSIAVELMEIRDVAHRTIPLRVQDPGTATVVFVVRDVDAALQRARAAKAEVVTPGGAPVAMTDGSRAVVLRDVDGRPLELRQPAAAATGPNENDLVAMRLSIAVADLARTVRVYRDILGFQVADEPAAPHAIRALTGIGTTTVRRTRIQAPGSTLWIELVEYGGVDRNSEPMRIQDRGAARLQLRAQNLDALVTAMKAAGLRVVSEGGAAVPIPPNFKGALVADPNGFFLTPFAPCDACAPTL